MLLPWGKKNGFANKTYEEMIKDKQVEKLLLDELVKFGKANDLKGFENVKRIRLEIEPFSVENDMLTPTFKLKRHQAKVCCRYVRIIILM